MNDDLLQTDVAGPERERARGYIQEERGKDSNPRNDSPQGKCSDVGEYGKYDPLCVFLD